ncbi:MAG: hypothetical protein PF518_16290 [Spirochaetaceae bacterium]|jgi:hypothetical protein|nr:hypothetical protein [Spirochaetaceae bacterium]
MKERKEVISRNIENVNCTMGTQSKKPNTVVMAISDDIVMDALSLYRDKKKSTERTEGLIRYELVAVFMEEVWPIMDIHDDRPYKDKKEDDRSIDPDKEEEADKVLKNKGFRKDDDFDELKKEYIDESDSIESMSNDLDEVLKDGEK